MSNFKPVFCDESGFTGDNLWQLDQPFFAYAAVSMDEQESSRLIRRIREKYRIKAVELHAAQLLKRDRGRTAIEEILEEIVPHSSVVIFHKRYSLAAKMFEYLVEPAISRCNSIFYDIGLHKFVANAMYRELLESPSNAEISFQAFQEIMRTESISKFGDLIGAMGASGSESFLNQVATIAICNKRKLAPEIASSDSILSAPRWILELTTAGLVSLLSVMSGKEMTPISVTCDDSKPLMSQAEMFEGMIKRDDLVQLEFDGRLHQVTYNLGHPIQFGSSASMSGIQLADILASSATYAMKMGNPKFSSTWLKKCQNIVHPNSVMPDNDEIDCSTPRSVTNWYVLNELVDRSVRGLDLINGMPEFIDNAKKTAIEFCQKGTVGAGYAG